MTGYAELQVTTNFSFLRGASHPEEMVATAARLGTAAIGIADRNTLAGIVRAHTAAKASGTRLIVGARLDLDDAPSLLCFPTDRAAYGRLCRLLSVGRRRAPKAECRLSLADVIAFSEGQMLVAVPPDKPDQDFALLLEHLKQDFGDRLSLAAAKLYQGDDDVRLATLTALGNACGVPLVATNDVHAHEATRRPLQDVLTCIREHCTLREAGYRLFANGERHLKPPAEMARLFRSHPDALARSLEIAGRCTFSLDELKYEYPIDPVPQGRTPQEELAHLSWLGADERYPDGVPAKVKTQIAHELELIATLKFAPYFLTVHDIVRFARERSILCQGRGSAANSAVCFCLGITAVDPARIEVLFERFISAERNEPPDIDVDFEHERREEVIQYVYQKYGRERAGMTATVISYRTKSALREVGKVFGLSDDAITALQRAFWRRPWAEVGADELHAAGLNPCDQWLQRVIALAEELKGFPRHLSQHTGGMVITRSPLNEVVPIGNAAMAERTVIEWDKNDLDALGILKIDILGLGMLSCVRKALALIAQHHGRRLTLATVPAEDAAVYAMLCRADSVGVFQVESRAQMGMLPRLKPKEFYDLVIEVAIVRPGPIQGDMVHPYLRRREGLEEVAFPSAELKAVLGKTLGVPLFQEQAMRIAIVAAGFTPSAADGLRRAMATFRNHGTIHHFRDRFIAGMTGRGYEADFALRCFRQIEGFADYGFPESHAASFALIVYVSAWLKCHYPAAFACALLNSQPMGFYAPAQIIADAKRHGVPVLPADVNASEWDCTLEPAATGGPALRLGFRQIKGLREAEARGITVARSRPFASIAELAARAGLAPRTLETLARADAFGSLKLDRRCALWAVLGLEEEPLPLFAALFAGAEKSQEPAVALPPAPLGEEVSDDYQAFGLSLKAHPVALLRARLKTEGYLPAVRIAALKHEVRVKTAGLVITRQSPGSAKGIIFITLEDETGQANLIVKPAVFARHRGTVLGAQMIGVEGRVQRQGAVVHVLARRLVTLDPVLARLSRQIAPNLTPSRAGDEARFEVSSRDFH
ncbi:Error-prone DNA polymerase [Candidatus Defluviicoccus seviourii]|uniref:Error-prone DNA polymerase n=1 Tax=Candidatus Defluviicoccus seviourii TaxID=2565273 RepID=A0A564W9H4_9PROT|nr:Error-prone DNA polymerase [Candidatus Defluviicoccus seviourii]